MTTVLVEGVKLILRISDADKPCSSSSFNALWMGELTAATRSTWRRPRRGEAPNS